MSPTLHEQDDSKRKRESSSNSTSSAPFMQKKAKEDFNSSNISEYTVFNTPDPRITMASESSPAHLSADAPSNSSVGVLSHSSSSEQQSHSASQSPKPPTELDIAGQFTQNPETKAFLADLLNSNRANIKADTLEVVNSVVDAKFSSHQEKIAQHVYDAVEHKVDNKFIEPEHQFNTLQTKYDKLEERLDKVDQKSVENDQYARRYTIRIRGIEEQRNEDLRAIVVHIVSWMHINIDEYDIEVIHRAGSYKPDKPRVILCRFKDRGLKYQVMLQRKMLKRTGITFEEDLCREYETLMYELKDHQNVQKTWSWNGKVHAEDKNGARHILRYGRNWSEFFDKIDEQPPPPQNATRPHLNNGSNSGQQPPMASAPPPTQSPVNTSPPQQASPAPPSSTAQSLSAPSSASVATSSPASISLAAVCSVSTSGTTNSLAQSASSTSTTVTQAVLGPIPASTASSSDPTMSYSMAAAPITQLPPQSHPLQGLLPQGHPPQRPTLNNPLKDIGSASTVMGELGGFRNPPNLTRFVGLPVVTMSPRVKLPGGLPGIGKGGSLPGTPRNTSRRGSASSLRTPKNQKPATERPPISPNISSYFTMQPS